MSKLALHIQHSLNEVAVELFNRFIATGQYQEQDYELLYEMICGNYMFLSAHGRHSINPLWFERYKVVSQLLADKLNRNNPKPLAGDCVLINCNNGKVYNDATITHGEDNSGTAGRLGVCVKAGCHIYDIHQSAELSLGMSVSGGYFQGVNADEITDTFDTVENTFWFWAEKPTQNGGLYINRPVRRWALKNINPNFY